MLVPYDFIGRTYCGDHIKILMVQFAH